MRSLWLLVGALLACFHAWAGECPPSAPGAQDVREAAIKFPPRDRGLLWRVSRNGRVSWLYGTLHVGRLEWLMPGPTVMRALRASDLLALELDLSNPAEVRALMPPVDRASARRVLAGELGARMEVQRARACIPQSTLDALRPAAQVLALMGVTARREGLHPELGADFILAGIAPRLGKRVVGLETAAQQMAVLTPATEDDEREIVADGLDEMGEDRSVDVLRRMALDWDHGDAEDVALYGNWCDCLRTEAQQRDLHRLLDERNPAMADRIAALHASGKSVFVAVGMLHMTGAASLVTLLRERGFVVERVRFGTAAAAHP